MIRALLPAVILGTSVHAEEKTCQYIEGSEDSCLYVIGCSFSDPYPIAADYAFEGTLRGWNGGGVEILTSDNVICEGTWAGTSDSSGQATLVCADGTGIMITGYGQIAASEPINATGIDTHGNEIEAWTDRVSSPEALRESTFRYRITNRRTCAMEGEFGNLKSAD